MVACQTEVNKLANTCERQYFGLRYIRVSINTYATEKNEVPKFTFLGNICVVKRLRHMSEFRPGFVIIYPASNSKVKGKGKVIPLQARCGPEGG